MSETIVEVKPISKWSKAALLNLIRYIWGEGMPRKNKVKDETTGNRCRYVCYRCGLKSHDYYEFRDHACKPGKVFRRGNKK